MAVDIINTKRAGIIEIDGNTFYPGANRVTDEVALKLQGLDYFRAIVAQDILRVQGAPEAEDNAAPVGPVYSLKGVKMDDVRRLVSESTDLTLLRAWLNTDARKETRKLIETRAAELLAEKQKKDADND